MASLANSDKSYKTTQISAENLNNIEFNFLCQSHEGPIPFQGFCKFTKGL
jgi:hypothetical protein